MHASSTARRRFWLGRATHTFPRVTNHFVIAGQGQYLVMDFIDGEDLRSKIAKGNLPNERLVVYWARQICDALHYLHNRHPPVVHRDIKPGNIRITPDGRVFLVDFGLARWIEGPATITGVKAITPGYSPPEQYIASRTDVRTDIYALAATLYTLLTNAIPEDSLERAVGLKTLTPIRTWNPKVSDGVASAVEKALEIFPTNRYQTIGEFQKALSQALPAAVPTPNVSVPSKKTEKAAAAVSPEKPTSPPKAPARGTSQRSGGLPLGCTMTVGFLVLLAIAGGLIFRFYRIRSYFYSPSVIVQPDPDVSIGSSEGNGARLPFSTVTQTETPATPSILPTPVGKSGTLAFVSDRTGVPQIYSMDFDGRNLRQITNLSEGACQPDWSPDGMQLVFTSPCKSFGGPYIASAVFRINADGSGQTTLTKVPGGDFDPAWSPDGKSIAVTSLEDGRQHIYVMDLNGDNRILVSTTSAIDYQPRWSPDGKRIVFVSIAADRPIVFIENFDPPGIFRTEFSNVTDPTMSPDWSIDNHILFVLGYRGQAVMYDENQRFTQTEITPRNQGTMVARFSPDGKWVLFDMNIKDNRDIYLLPIAGENVPRRITLDSSIETDPAWRPIPADA